MSRYLDMIERLKLAHDGEKKAADYLLFAIGAETIPEAVDKLIADYKQLAAETARAEKAEAELARRPPAWGEPCRSEHPMLGVTCILAAGHAGNHNDGKEAEREKSSPAAQGESELRSERQPSGRPSKIR